MGNTLNTGAPGANLNSLFGSALNEGSLSAGSANTLCAQDIGAKIKAGLGTPVDEVNASEVVLLTVLIDDSSSMGGNEQVLMDGYNNLVIQALKDTKQSDGILVHTRYLSDFILDPYTFIDTATPMTPANYSAHLGYTPLHDQTLVTLGAVIAKTQDFANNGVHVRSITLILTDGENNYGRHSAAEVAKVVADMRASENHIIAAMGIGWNEALFRREFTEMGIDPKWILTPKNTPTEVRAALQVFSRSAVRASQSAKNFSQAAGGGFGS